MKVYTLFFIILTSFCLSCNTRHLSKEKITEEDGFSLVWSDEFDGSSLDTTKWNIQEGTGTPLNGWGNNEHQYYTKSAHNIRLENGLLVIEVHKDSVGGKGHTSARINTKGKGDFKYGRIEARIKLPEGQGIWPAFWMLPTDNTYGNWPKSGEVDIMEMVGQHPDTIYGTIHCSNFNWPWAPVSLPNSKFSDDFHLFRIDWKEDTITWYLDAVQFAQRTKQDVSPARWPFNERFHLLLNCAVGGNLPGPPDSTTPFPQRMEVDYVRVYRL